MFSQQNSEFQQDFYSASNISLFNQHFSVFSQQNPCIIRAEYLLTYSGRRGIGTAEEEVYTVEDWQQSIWREIRETNLLSPNCLAKENMFPQITIPHKNILSGAGCPVAWAIDTSID